MTGHEQIVRFRRAGKRPVAAFVVVGRHPRFDAEHELEDGELPTVYTGDTDPAVADLRCLVGLRVHLNYADGCDPAHWWRWFDAVHAAKPAQIFGVEPSNEEVVTWPM